MGTSGEHDRKVNVMLVYSDTGWGSAMVLRNLIPVLNKEKYRVVAGIITPDPAQPLRAPVPEGVDAVRLVLPKDNFSTP